MSQRKEEVNEDIDPESSSNDSSQLSSSVTSDSSSNSGGETRTSSGTTGTTASSYETDGCKQSRQSNHNDLQSGGRTCPKTIQAAGNQGDLEPSVRIATEERIASVIHRDDVIQRSQSTTGRKCDTATRNVKTSCPGSPRLGARSQEVGRQLNAPISSQSPSTSYQSERLSEGRHTSRPAPSTSSSILDTNNNKNSQSSNLRIDNYSRPLRNNFGKSASGSRLGGRIEARSKVCDCLSQQCSEKQHSSRRQFIENYYNSRTRSPSSTAMSSLNISSPLNRLSECDAITKRLLSSPIRTVNFTENPARKTKIGEVDKSRRASLGTNTLTDQVSLFNSSPFNSLELSYGKRPGEKTIDNQIACDPIRQSSIESMESDTRQQQARSFSMCQDDCFQSRFKIGGPNHSSNFNRAVSLACEFGAPKQMMTIIPLFGCDIKALGQFMKWGLVLPPAIDSAVDHILSHGVDSIGIFRKSGVKSRILTLKHRIESNQEATLEQINKDNEFSIYDIADLVKMWFRELKPMPIMTKDLIRLISSFLKASGSSGMQLTSSQQNPEPDRSSRNPHIAGEQLGIRLKEQMNSIISPTHKALFFKALNFFASISSKSEINQMTSQNLAICLAPSLCATESDQDSILVAQRALKYCIDNHKILF